LKAGPATAITFIVYGTMETFFLDRELQVYRRDR